MEKQRQIQGVLGSIGVVLLLGGCAVFKTAPATPSIAPLPPTTEPAATSGTTLFPITTPLPSPDPCTGWWCSVAGVVYAGTAHAGSELEGVTVMLHQTSYCSPTSGQHQIATGTGGSFEFGDVFFHDTDRIRIQVESEGHESFQWDSSDLSCLYCSCFTDPLEIVLDVDPGS